MKRRIVLRLMGEEILDLTIDEDDYAEELTDSEPDALGAAIDTQPKTVGFGTPWSVEYWDDED
jgi:hypothetical protein